MKKKIMIISVISAVILVLMTMTSVIGYQPVKNIIEKNESPLFQRNIKSAVNKESIVVNSNYIGKGRILKNYFSQRLSIQRTLDRAVKLIRANPKVLDKLVDRIYKNQELMDILAEYDVNREDIESQVKTVKKNPDIIIESIDEIALSHSSIEDTLPVGLSTSSVLGCIILLIALLPLFLVIGILIATVTLITCLNLNGCFEALLNNLLEGFTQDLDEPNSITRLYT